MACQHSPHNNMAPTQYPNLTTENHSTENPGAPEQYLWVRKCCQVVPVCCKGSVCLKVAS